MSRKTHFEKATHTGAGTLRYTVHTRNCILKYTLANNRIQIHTQSHAHANSHTDRQINPNKHTYKQANTHKNKHALTNRQTKTHRHNYTKNNIASGEDRTRCPPPPPIQTQILETTIMKMGRQIIQGNAQTKTRDKGVITSI